MVRLPTFLVAALAVLKARNEAAVTERLYLSPRFPERSREGSPLAWLRLGLPPTIIAQGLSERRAQ